MAIVQRQNIEINAPRDLEVWAMHLGVSSQDLASAIGAVGTDLDDVTAYLASAREPMGAYVNRMRARLDEIEIQFQKLVEERKSIVSFLEGFARLQRSQRQSNGELTFTISMEEGREFPDAYHMHLDEVGFREVHRHSGSGGSSALILETVHRLLSDGKRRSIHDILSFLEVRGIPFKTANPAGFLSTLLSRDSRFDANRRDGWGLASSEK